MSGGDDETVKRLQNVYSLQQNWITYTICTATLIQLYQSNNTFAPCTLYIYSITYSYHLFICMLSIYKWKNVCCDGRLIININDEAVFCKSYIKVLVQYKELEINSSDVQIKLGRRLSLVLVVAAPTSQCTQYPPDHDYLWGLC